MRFLVIGAGNIGSLYAAKLAQSNPHPHDQKRAIELGIGINITPLWATNWGNNMEQALIKLGQKRIDEMYQPLRAALDAGGRVRISAETPTAETIGTLARKVLSSLRHADSRRLARAVLGLLARSIEQS